MKKRLQRIMALLLAGMLIFGGCGKEPEEPVAEAEPEIIVEELEEPHVGPGRSPAFQFYQHTGRWDDFHRRHRGICRIKIDLGGEKEAAAGQEKANKKARKGQKRDNVPRMS